MRLLFDLCHPAHVHFFKQAIRILKSEGHEILVTARDKDCTLALLKSLNIEHQVLYTRRKSSYFSLAHELFMRNKALYHVIKSFKPDLMAGIGGTFISHVSLLTKVPAFVFYDGDNAFKQNLITYPFASKIFVPDCYQGWTIKYKTTSYSGFHELAYLHPNYFAPSRDIALKNGLHPNKPTFLIRLVGWQASHDKGHRGFTPQILETWVNYLTKHAHVIISSEIPLQDSLAPYRYKGKQDEIHHVMAYCKGFLGESPTMAIESAILGVPSVYLSSIQCGNILKIQNTFQLIKHMTPNQANFKEAFSFLSQSLEERQRKTKHLLEDTVDVTAMIVQIINQTPIKKTSLACKES